MKTLFEGRGWRWAAWVMVGTKLWLGQALHILAVGGAKVDDQLFVTLAEHLVKGEWLGPYTYLTLAKGPVYPMFMAGSFLLGLPLGFAQQLAYVAACWLVAKALNPLIPRDGALFLLFAMLLWNPMSYEVMVLGRVLRQNIGTPLAMAVFAGASGLALRAGRPLREQVGWGALLGLAFGLFWLTREEGVWILPVGAIVLAGVGLPRAFRGGIAAVRGLLAAGLLAAVGGWVVIAAVSEMNYRHYGWYGTVELFAPEFLDAYGALQRVYPRGQIPMVPVSRAARERIYAVSPAFARLRPWLEGPNGESMADGCSFITGHPKQDREIAGGWFLWLLRESVQLSGSAPDVRTELAFYARLAREVNTACDSGKLPSGPPHTGLMPVWQPAYTARLPGTLLRYADYFTSFRGFNVGPGTCPGSDEELARFRDITRDRLYPVRGKSSRVLPLEAAADRERREILYWIGKTMRWVLWIGGWCAAALWLGGGWIAWKRRSLGAAWMITAGLIASCAALIGIDALIEVSSFPLMSPGALAEAYPLWIAFVVLTWIGGADALSALGKALRKKVSAVRPGDEAAG